MLYQRCSSCRTLCLSVCGVAYTRGYDGLQKPATIYWLRWMKFADPISKPCSASTLLLLQQQQEGIFSSTESKRSICHWTVQIVLIPFRTWRYTSSVSESGEYVCGWNVLSYFHFALKAVFNLRRHCAVGNLELKGMTAQTYTTSCGISFSVHVHTRFYVLDDGN